MKGWIDFTDPSAVELRHEDVATDLLRLVPRSVAHDEERVAVFAREHVPGVKAQTERRRTRPERRHRLSELIATVPQFGPILAFG